MIVGLLLIKLPPHPPPLLYLPFASTREPVLYRSLKIVYGNELNRISVCQECAIRISMPGFGFWDGRDFSFLWWTILPRLSKMDAMAIHDTSSAPDGRSYQV